MKQNKWMLLVGIAVLSSAIACGAKTPTSPASTALASGEAGASGETLKVGAPTPTSPIGGTQLQTATVVLTFTGVTGTYTAITPSYQLELRDAAGTLVANPTITTTSYTVTASLALDSTHTWRVRAVYQGANGPWSATATFKTQVAAFISGNTLYDPLSTGITVGTRNGSTTFVAGQGLKLNTQDSTVRYNLPTTLTSGQFSMLILGADEGGAGDKSKVFSMQEGSDDITTNDYRMTAELRGSQYATPGAVTCRIITGNNEDTSQIHDCTRVTLAFDSSRWYFWSFTWDTSSARLIVRRDNETGTIIYSQGVGFNHVYRPTPHTLWLGAPVGRAGNQDATIGGGPIYKNVYAGPSARPTFPALIERLFGGN
ncbi:MAG: hypothetical protein EPO35_06850 [Acidobacteria bacterium]|nr:MAG: hypothetical protein EPO35_06850 [Acidobacteriota bacterium]